MKMQNKLIELIDFEKLNVHLEGFNKTTGFVTAILDLEGNVLSKSGWRQICTEFHRVHHDTSNLCRISDTELAGKLAEGEKYHFYKCLNGLVDVAVPIVINGEHIANLFSGQFFFEEPDKEFFIKQAKKYKFNIDTYLAALEKVPVVSQEKVKTAMDFLLNITLSIIESSAQRIEQIQLNDNLRESEITKTDLLHKFNEAQQLTKIGSWDWNLKTNMIWWSDETYQIFGVSPNDFTPDFEANGKFIHPDDFEKYAELFEHSLKTGEPLDYNFRLITRSGIIKHCKAGGKVTYDKSGQPEIFIGTVMDNTIQHKIEEELKKEQQFLKAVFDNLSDGIVACDPNGILSRFNKAAVEFHGLPNEPITVDQWAEKYDLYHSDGITQLKKEEIPLFKALKEGFVKDAEMMIKPNNGVSRIVSSSGQILKDSDGKILGAVVAMHDITERKKAEEEIKKLNEELEHKITDRTKELGKKVIEIENINRLFVDRELRMIELKNKINALEERLNKKS